MAAGNRLNEEALARATEWPNAHKAELVRLLYRYQKLEGLSLAELGETGGVAWVTLSRLFGGNLAQVSTDKLLGIFARLGVHIAIQVDLSPSEIDAGRLEVHSIGETRQQLDPKIASSGVTGGIDGS
ncbi:MAG: hypothetical protein JWR80_4239 [Bradyrhizobium sp.]|nr:hypothetical protein [Bradyrhizobium sp.]